MKEILDAIVIGAGITGIGAAYYLQKDEFSYKIFEKNDQVGGVWNTQKWHGVRCDSDMIKYSFSFMPFISPQCLHGGKDIQNYLRSVTEKFNIVNHIQFNTEVKKIRFDSQEHIWHVTTTQGTFYSRFIFNGHGYFSNAYVPEFPDQDKFKGEIVHSFDLDGKRTFYNKDVVVVGSGATAVCLAPAISEVSKSVTLLQRSPSYIYEHSNKVSWRVRLAQKLHKMGFHFPITLIRFLIQFKDDFIFMFFRTFPTIGKKIFRRFWEPFVGKKTYEDHFVPKYAPWEQRIPVSIGMRSKIVQGKMGIKTSEIVKFDEREIHLANGEKLPCDVCVLATGFHVNFFKLDGYVNDKKIDYRDINLFKGIIIGGIPNYFQPLGVLHSTWTQRSEVGTKYALKIMRYMRKKNLKSFEVERKSVQSVPSLKANYLLRHIDIIPKLHGSWDLPSIDNLLFYWFRPSLYKFSK